MQRHTHVVIHAPAMHRRQGLTMAQVWKCVECAWERFTPNSVPLQSDALLACEAAQLARLCHLVHPPPLQSDALLACEAAQLA